MNPKNLQTYANRVVEGMESLVTMNGYNDCIIGVVTTFNGDQVIAYDIDKVIARLQERDGMSYTDASEYFDYNMLGAWVGDHTPIFISMLEEQHKEPADGPPFEIEYGEDDEEGLRLVP
tara:strand:- start:208 stop:564 length:357 start_codon:yes stop_codon:yes gene_type:complete